MSGIAGVLNLDRAPANPEILRRMLEFLAYRGPDAQNLWVEGPVGLAHAALWTTFESKRERQPLSLDGQVWITADARIDDQAELLRQLHQVAPVPQDAGPASVPTGRDATSGIPEGATDTVLILLAYYTWGEACVEHLLGDFAFALWDGRERRLFCARDPLGIKPFYYAQVGNSVIFSNSLDCVRQHPAVSNKLNDAAIADFLLCGFNKDLTTSTFADVRRLEAARTAVWSEGGFCLRRYWTLPIDEPLIYPRPDDYAERFRELLRAAVRDRLRTDRLGVFMSGGLDSSGLAAIACELCREPSFPSPVSRPAAQSLRAAGRVPPCGPEPSGGGPYPVSLQAFTVVYDRIIPDQERHYAGLVAKHLDIPIEFSPRDAETSTPWVERCAPETPEPVSDPFSLTFEFEFQKRIASRCRVFLYGEGPDNALKCDWRAHLNYLVQQRRWGRLLPDFWYHVVGHPRIPYVGRIANWSYERARRRFPPWLNEDFARRFRLRERWGEDAPGPPNPHPTRPTSYGSMSPTIWQPFLDGCDLLGSRTLSEFVHPYLDLRFLRFLLAVPAIPWCCNKNLSRLAMRSSLPDPVLRRPKSPITKDPLFERACLLGMPKFPITESFSSYVIPGLVPEKRSASNPEFWADMRAISLAHWLSKSYGAT